MIVKSGLLPSYIAARSGLHFKNIHIRPFVIHKCKKIPRDKMKNRSGAGKSLIVFTVKNVLNYADIGNTFRIVLIIMGKINSV